MPPSLVGLKAPSLAHRHVDLGDSLVALGDGHVSDAARLALAGEGDRVPIGACGLGSDGPVALSETVLVPGVSLVDAVGRLPVDGQDGRTKARVAPEEGRAGARVNREVLGEIAG